jgi:uncharacterized protein YggE
LLDQVVQAGANSIYGVSFSVEDPKALREQARAAAIEDAKAHAAQLAQVAGASLGEVLVITENIGSQPPVPLAMAARDAVAEAGAPVPVQPGEQTFSADVQVTFELR